MSLSHIYKLVRKLEPSAHDLAHCPKPSGSQYAWRVASPERRSRIERRG